MLIWDDTIERMIYMLTTVEKIKVIMKRNNFDERELTAIANALGCELEINFVNRETGEKIEL